MPSGKDKDGDLLQDLLKGPSKLWVMGQEDVERFMSAGQVKIQINPIT